MSLQSKVVVLLVAVLVLAAGLVVLNYVAPGDDRHLVAGFNAEFLQRPDGYPGLGEAYRFRFRSEPKQMDSGLMYKACSDGAVDVICGFATDGRIAAYDLLALEDDRQFFPPYYAAPLVRAGTLREHPELEEILNRLAGRIDNETMGTLNLQVDRSRAPRKCEDVARDFLVAAGLIDADAKPGDGSAGTIRIGGKDFTEQSILGEIFATLIECSSNIAVERKLYLGGTMICFNAIRAGDLDLYAEYTGTGLVNILKGEVVRDGDEAYRIVQREFKKQFGLIWLKPLGFNNTYTLTMRREQAEKLSIRRISELAQYIRADRQGP